MNLTIGIRREDKNEWEKRVPLTPPDVAELQQKLGLRFIVQPSSIRIYADEDYRSKGIQISEDLEPASLIFAVKEVPPQLLREGKAYVFFSHVVKGQVYNMPLLRRLLDLGCSLVDYERIVDEKNRRLIFFGRHAGHAGMIETLWGLGQRLEATGVPSPLAKVKHAFEYSSLTEAKTHLSKISDAIESLRPPEPIKPLVVGFSGYGNVSIGAQEVLDSLDLREIPAEQLSAVAADTRSDTPQIVKVVFKEEDMVRPQIPGNLFNLQEYYDNPERYQGCFEQHLPHLDILVNAIYWEPRYPRLVTKKWAKENYLASTPPRLKVIGDISCDIEGSIELTLKATQPDQPCYVYDPARDAIRDGVIGNGPVVMAVDNLPCELPRESSQSFSAALREMVADLAGANWQSDFSRLELPPYLKNALIVHKGELTPHYQYLHQHLEA